MTSIDNVYDTKCDKAFDVVIKALTDAGFFLDDNTINLINELSVIVSEHPENLDIDLAK